MTNRRRSVRTLASISAVGLLVTGCSFFSSSRDIDPCELLSPSELSSFGDYGEPTRKSRGNKTKCTWYNSTTEPLKTTVKPQLNIQIAHKVRFSTVLSRAEGERQGTTAAGRPFTERELDNSCTVTMPVYKEPSRKQTGIVDVAVTMPDPEDNCPTAREIADLVAPKLR